MKIPDKIKIGGIQYLIVQSQKLDGSDGEYNSENKTIKLCKTLPQDIKELTLFHEILEAGCSPLSEKTEGHALMEMIAQLYYQVLRDNDFLK